MYQAIVARKKLEREKKLEKNNKLMSIRDCFEKDLKAADFMWSLFVASCQNHKYDTLVKPFPPQFLRENGSKDIDHLLSVIQETPTFSVVLQKIHEPDVCEIKEEVIDLLYWLFVTMKEPHLKVIDQECFDSVLSRARCEKPIAKPDYIYQLVRSNKSPAAIRWQTLCKNNTTLYAYHGCNIENYFSFIYNGMKLINKDLCQQNSLFDYGICFSRELGGSIPYSPFGYGWGGSTYSSTISCTAVCEYINHSNYIMCSKPHLSEANIIPGNDLGDVGQDEYFSVTNAHFIELRYLLVYCRPTPKQENPVTEWFKKHKLFTFLFGYGILLSAVAFMNIDDAVDNFNCC